MRFSMSGARIPAVILAGGRSRRMEYGDKSLLPLDGKPMIERIAAVLSPQVSTLAVNANGDPQRFAFLGLPVVQDAIPGFQGPLAGIHAGMIWATKHHPDISDIVTVPCDVPFLPEDLIQRLIEGRAAARAQIAIACSGGQMHPTVALWPVGLADALGCDLTNGGPRSVHQWLRKFDIAQVHFANGSCDPFFNINTKEHLGQAVQRLMPKISKVA
jgi:molybdenum cofactor guanylyltransferase